jgi:MFS family permease
MPPVFWRLNLVVVSCNIATVGGRLALLLAAQKLGASPVALGVLIGLFSLPGMLTSVWVGRWFDRHDARRSLLVNALLVGATGALVFARFELDAIFVASLLYGFAINVIQIGVQNLTGHYSNETNRTSAYNLVALALSLSLLLGPALAGFSIDHLGYRGCFLLLALIPLAGVFALVGRELPPRQLRAAPLPGQREVHVVALLREPGMRRLFTLELLFASGWDALTFLVPIYGSQLGLSASAIGMISSTSSLAVLMVRLFVPWLARRIGTWHTLALALFLTGTGYLGFPWFESAPALGALAFVIGAGLGMGLPISMTLIYELSPAGRAGEVIGLRTATMRGCHTFLPLLSGNLGAAIGIAPVFGLFALLILGGAWMASAVAARARREARAQPR